MSNPPIAVKYRNYKGRVAIRNVILGAAPYWGKNEWHPEEQYLWDVYDVDEEAWRTFAVKDMNFMDAGVGV